MARAAVSRQRRAVTVESMPLTRLLADVVLRPPDIRHLDAAFQAIAAAPRGQSSLKVSLSELFASRCATCGRSVAAEELTWSAGADGRPRPTRKSYRCPTCRAQQGGPELRHAPVDEADIERATVDLDVTAPRREIRDRFPLLDGRESLADDLVDLQTPRQLVYLQAILQRIETDLRAPQVEAALRLALAEAILPASRLAASQGRIGALRIAGARARPPALAEWRERNPWVAFEDGYRAVRAFIQALEADPLGAVQARTSEDILSLGEGMTTAVVRLGSPAGFRALADEVAEVRSTDLRRRIRLVLGQLPLRWTQDRLSLAYYLTAWVMGRDAAASLPLEPLFGTSIRPSWSWQSAALRRSLTAAAPLAAADAHAVILVDGDGGAEGVVAAVLGGVSAGYRLVATHLPEAGEPGPTWIELSAPGAPAVSAARTYANRALPPLATRSFDASGPRARPAPVEPERVERGPFSAAEAARTVTETAVEVLQARGEPAGEERLLGEILLGLDRTGQLRRFVSSTPEMGPDDDAALPAPAEPLEPTDDRARSRRAPGNGRGRSRAHGATDDGGPGAAGDAGGRATASGSRDQGSAAAARSEAVAVSGGVSVAQDRVEVLLGIIRDELQRPTNRRLTEIEPGRWWLAQVDDQDACALPLSDRVEWAVFSLLATASRVSESAFHDRIASLFTGPDAPDDAYVRACLESYRGAASTPEALVASDDLARRSEDHARIVATLVELGHRLGMRAWIAPREQTRRVGSHQLVEWLDEREVGTYLPLIGRGPAEELEQVDVIWYIRQRATFLFEVEWTAMLGETLLRRHARIPTTDQVVRFLVVAPERTELLREKLARSPLLRRAMEQGNWHILKWDQLRALVARETVTLPDLEPALGLDPDVDRGGEQMPLFES